MALPFSCRHPAIAADLSVNEQLLRTPKYGSVEDIEALLAKGGDVNAKGQQRRDASHESGLVEETGHREIPHREGGRRECQKQTLSDGAHTRCGVGKPRSRKNS